MLGGKTLRNKMYATLFLAVILTGILPLTYMKFANADESLYKTVAFWHFDQLYTPDATGKDNVGILGGSPPPTMIEGRFGKALDFDGENFVYVPFNPNLYTEYEITIEAWIYVKAFKNVTYNNIIVICHSAGLAWQTATRICGLAITPAATDVNNETQFGFLRGYIYTDKEHFNEIITIEPVICLGKWIHVAFVRNLVTGMHLYVNGQERETKVTWGMRNPTGRMIMGTEIYFGHDAEIIIDEPRICNTALNPSQFILESADAIIASRTEIDIGPNLMMAIIIAALIFAAAWLLRRIVQTWGMTRSSG